MGSRQEAQEEQERIHQSILSQASDQHNWGQDDHSSQGPSSSQ